MPENLSDNDDEDPTHIHRQQAKQYLKTDTNFARRGKSNNSRRKWKKEECVEEKEEPRKSTSH